METLDSELPSSGCIVQIKANVNDMWKYVGSDSYIWNGHVKLEEKLVFLHIQPYDKDIYDHIRCSTALLWQLLPSWELELVADITPSWKQWRSNVHSDNPFCKTHWMFSGILPCTYTKKR